MNKYKKYFLSVPAKDGKWLHHDFYTATELQKLPECEIALSTLLARLKHFEKNGNSRFKTLWGVITAPNTSNGNRINIVRKEDYSFEHLMKLWPVGSLAGEIN